MGCGWIAKNLRRTVSDHIDTSKDEVRSAPFWRDVFGEILASFYLMSIQCTINLGWGRTIVKGSDMQNNLAMGGGIFVLIEGFGQYGGAHMNPAVSIAFLVDGRITLLRTLLYIPAQLLGVTAGAWFVYFITPLEYRETLASTQIHSGLTVSQGFLCEMWLTAFLLTIVYGSMNEHRRPVFMNSLVIGFWVFVASAAGGMYTGASMNPARSFGPAVVTNNWKNHWVYWIAPITGALLATMWNKFFFDRIGHPNTKRRASNVREGKIGTMQTSTMILAMNDLGKTATALAKLPLMLNLASKTLEEKPRSRKASHSQAPGDEDTKL